MTPSTEELLNIYGSLLIGAAAVETGVLLWRHRKWSWREYFSIVLVGWGLRGLLWVHVVNL